MATEEEKRNCRIVVVAGQQRIGKSNETMRVLFFDSQGRKGLIFDINKEYGQYKVYLKDGTFKICKAKRIFHRDIKRFSIQRKIEVARVITITDEGKEMTNEEIDDLLLKCLKEFRGGILLIEDLNQVFGDALPVKFSGYLTNVAHRDSDLYIHLQSVGRILPKMLQNTAFVRCHRQFEGIENSKGKLKDEYEIFKIAQIIVNTQYDSGNIRFFLFVDRLGQKIIGKLSMQMLQEAVGEYLSTHKKILAPLLDRRNENGGKVFDYFTAMKTKTEQLVTKYYGNKI